MNDSVSSNSKRNVSSPISVKNPLFYNFMAYATQLFGQNSLIMQNLMFIWVNSGVSDGARAIAQTLISLPWLGKPLYGLFCDFKTLGGQHRKSYLMLVTCGAGVVYGSLLSAVWLLQLSTPWLIVPALMLASFFWSVSDVNVDGMMVSSNDAKEQKRVQAMQWLAMESVSVAVLVASGWITQAYADDPIPGLSIGLFCTMLAPLILAVLTWFSVSERKREPGTVFGGDDAPKNFKEALVVIKSIFSTPIFWMTAAFIFFYNFSPSLGAAFQRYSMDTLGFKEYQDFLGYTGAVTSVFSAIGLIVYLLLLKSMSVRKYIIAVSTTAAVAFYFVPLPVLETYAAGWMGIEGDMNSHLLALMMWLGSIACMASIALTTVCLNKITTRRLLHFGVTVGVIGSLVTFYQLVDTPAGEWFQHVLMDAFKINWQQAILLNTFIVGMAFAMPAGLLTTVYMNLAASRCDLRLAAFNYALFMTVRNFAKNDASNLLGTYLYTNWFESFIPLIYIGAITTLLCSVLWVPLLLGPKNRVSAWYVGLVRSYVFPLCATVLIWIFNKSASFWSAAAERFVVVEQDGKRSYSVIGKPFALCASACVALGNLVDNLAKSDGIDLSSVDEEIKPNQN